MWLQVELPAAVTWRRCSSTPPRVGVGGGRGGRAQLTTGPGARGQTGAAPAVAAADGPEPQAGRGAGPAAVPRPVPGFPREYQVQLSLDGKDWGKPVATGRESADRRCH